MNSPVVVIGAGLAGLTVALKLAHDRDVVVLAKRARTDSATAWAQGGIVGVLDIADSVDQHVDDTLKAGAGLVDPEIARWISEKSKSAVQWLVEVGVPFSPDPEGLSGSTSREKGDIRSGGSRMLPMQRARPSMRPCWRVARVTQESRSMSIGSRLIS